MFGSIWYSNLTKPILTPPAWVFAPVWIILYGMILVSVLLYSITASREKKLSGYVYLIIHMIFNLLWSPVFFLLHKIGIAFVVIMFMDFTAVLMTVKFFKISKISGTILFPYIIWIFFATYLNLKIYLLN